MKRFERILALLLVLMLIPVCALAEAAAITVGVAEIGKYGNVDLALDGRAFLTQGFEIGDVITVSFDGKQYDMPICTGVTDVEVGEMACCIAEGTDGRMRVVLVINQYDWATQTGLATREPLDGGEGFVWRYLTQEPPMITITMKEKCGFYEQWKSGRLELSNVREDYAHLTDADYANFRAVETTGMAAGRLYRSSSPIDPEFERNSYADAAAAAAGIATSINLSDDPGDLENYATYSDSYYSTTAVRAFGIGYDFASEDSENKFAEALRFMIANEAPYMIHCVMGKDRTGFLVSIPECLMGATFDEVISDYMLTYYNYYGVGPGTELYDKLAERNIIRDLSVAFGVDDLKTADLQAEAREYLIGIGLTEDEIVALQTALAP